MEESILTGVKKILGLDADYIAFDHDVITHINSALSSLNQLDIGPADGLTIADDSVVWGALGIPNNQLGMVRSYIYLKVRMLFDPPTTSFHIEAMNKQIEEYEWRLCVFRDEELALAAEEV